jgi:hypothetical protein
MKKNITSTILLMIIGFGFSLISLEFLCRLSGYSASICSNAEKAVIGANGYFWICDRKLGWRNRPNGVYCNENFIPSSVSTTDKLGFRDGFGGLYNNDYPIILFLGDSTTFCLEVNDEETGPSEVGKLLSKKFKVRVLNAGVRGYNTLQSKRMLEECLERFPASIIAVYVYYDNDYFENVDSDLYFPAKAPILRWDQGKFEVIEVTEPTVPWGQSFFEIYRRKAVKSKETINNISHFLRSNSVLVHQSMLALRNIINITFNPWHNKIERARKNYAEEALTETVRQMKQLCQDKGVTFISTYYYTGSRQYGSEITDYEAICKRIGVKYINIKKYFVDVPSSYMTKNCDNIYDPHYGIKGTKTFALALAPPLEAILQERNTLLRK